MSMKGILVAHATTVNRILVAHATSSTRYASAMDKLELQSWRLERLEAAIAKLTGGNVSAFGRLLGHKDGAFVRQLRAQTRNISEDTVMAIESLPGMAGWFDAPRSTDVKNQTKEISSAPTADKTSAASAYNVPHAGENFDLGPDIKPRRYPEISWVQAGMWAELCENFQPDEHTVWHQCHIDLGPCGFVVTVRGPSMTAPPGAYPSFPDGIKLFVSPDSEALPGKYVIARRDGKATFKKLVLVEGDLYLEAINPGWPERYQRVQEGDQFCGVVRHAGFDL
ncbi:hypothetical protein D9M68_122860 [compost metagenome]